MSIHSKKESVRGCGTGVDNNNNNTLSTIGGHHTLHFTTVTSAPFFGGISQCRVGGGGRSKGGVSTSDADVCGSAPHTMQLVDNVETAARTIDAFYSSPSSSSSSSPFSVASNVLRRYAPSEGLVDVSRSHHSWLVVEQGVGSPNSDCTTTTPTTLRDHLSQRLLNTSSRRAFQLSATTTASQGAIIHFHLSECRQTVQGLLQTICALQELSTMPTCKHTAATTKKEGDIGDMHNSGDQSVHIVSAPLRFLSKPIIITSSSADKHPPSSTQQHVTKNSISNNNEDDDNNPHHHRQHFAATPTTVRCFSSTITPSTIVYNSYGTPTLPSPATSLLQSLVVDMSRSFRKDGGVGEGVTGGVGSHSTTTLSSSSLRRPFEVEPSIDSAPYLSPMLLWSQSQQHQHTSTCRSSTKILSSSSIRHVQTVADDIWSIGVLALEWLVGIADFLEGGVEGGGGASSTLHASLFHHPNIKQRYHNIKALGAAWRRLKGEGRTTDVSPQQTPPTILRVAKAIATLLSLLSDSENDDDDSLLPSSSSCRRSNSIHIDPLHTSQQNTDIIRTLFGIGTKENLSSFVDFIMNVCLEWDDESRWNSFREMVWDESTDASSSALIRQDALLHPSTPSAISSHNKLPNHHYSNSTTTSSPSPSSAFRQRCLVPYLRVVKRTASAEHGHLNVMEVRQQAMYLEWARLLWGLTLTPNSPFYNKVTTKTSTVANSHANIAASIERVIQQQQQSETALGTTTTTTSIQTSLLESMMKLLSTYQQQQESTTNNTNKAATPPAESLVDDAVQFVRSLLGGQQMGVGSIASILSTSRPQSTSIQLHFHIESTPLLHVQEASTNSNIDTSTITSAPSTTTSSGNIILEHIQRRHTIWQERQVATNGACNVSLLDIFGVKPAPIALLPQCPVTPLVPDPSTPSSPSSPSSPKVTNNTAIPPKVVSSIGSAPIAPPSALLSQIALCQQREVDKETRRRRHHGNNHGSSSSQQHGHGGSGGFLLPAAPTAASRNELYTSPSQQYLDDQLSASSSSAASSVGGGPPMLGDVTRENTGVVSSSSAVSTDRSAPSHAASPSRRSTYASARCKSLAAVFSEEPPARPHVLTHIRMLAMDPSVSAKAFGRHLDRIRKEEQGELERAFEKFCAGPWNTKRSTSTTSTANDASSSPLLPSYFQRAILWSAGTTSSSSSSDTTTPHSRALRVPIVPTTLRSICWAKLLGVPACGAGRHAVVDAPYRAINTYKPSGSDRQIAVDIPRCHQYHHLLSTVEGHRRLTRILKGWLYDVERESEFVYWQGVDSVAAVLLTTNFEDEALACASLRRVVDTYVPHYFNKIANTMDQRLVTFQHVLKYVDPEVALHLEDISCRPELYSISWFLTLFAHVLPIEKVLLMWDAMLKSGHASFPVCIAVGIISQLREEIGKREFSEVVTLLSTGSVQGVLDVAIAAEDASVLFSRIPPSVLSPRFEGSYGTLVTSSTCAMIEVGDLVRAFNTRCENDTTTNHSSAGELWASAGVFLIDLRLDEERVRGATKWGGGGSDVRTAPRRGGSVMSTSSLASTTTSSARRVGGGGGGGGVDGLVDDFVYIDSHVTPSSSTTNLFPDNNHNDDDDEEQGPREVLLGALHCPFDGLDGWDVDDVIAQLCQHSLMWLPSSQQSTTRSGGPSNMSYDDTEDGGANDLGHGGGGGGLGGGSSVSAIQAFMSTAPHVVLIAGSNPESAQAAAADLVEQGTACVSILAGGIRNVRSGFPSLVAIVSDNL